MVGQTFLSITIMKDRKGVYPIVIYYHSELNKITRTIANSKN